MPNFLFEGDLKIYFNYSNTLSNLINIAYTD